MQPVGTKIKDVRLKKGMSQEELAQSSQISLRTIQRIENNENEPRGKTMQLICNTLEINIEELLDYGKSEDRQFLMFFHLSVVLGAFVPIGNIVLPLILWLTKKDKIQGLQKIGARLLNFQIVWTFFSFAIPVVLLSFNFFEYFENEKFENSGLFSFSTILISIGGFNFFNYLLAAIFALYNYRGKQITYPSLIPIIK